MNNDLIACPKCGYEEKGFFTAMAKNLGNWFTKKSVDEAILALENGVICPICKTRIIKV